MITVIIAFGEFGRPSKLKSPNSCRAIITGVPATPSR